MVIPARTPQERAFLVQFIAERIKITPKDLVGDMPFEVLGAVDARRGLLGAVLYINFRGPSIEMTCAGMPGWLTRANLREFFGYPFLELGCKRVTGIVHRKNKHARKINERLGFKLEGVCPDGFENGDAMIYGMRKKDCRWL